MSSRHLMRAALVLLLGLGTAFPAAARPTMLKHLHGIEPSLVDAFAKQRIRTTRAVVDYMYDWKDGAIRRWAGKKKLPADAVLLTVRMCRLLELKPITEPEAFLLTAECEVHAPDQLKRQETSVLTECLRAGNAKHNLLPDAPTEDQVDAWKRAVDGDGDSQVIVAHKIPLTSLYNVSDKELDAFKKRRWNDTLALFDALSLSSERTRFARRFRLPETEVHRLFALADLHRLEAIGPKMAQLMWLANIKSLAQLKSSIPSLLRRDLADLNKEHHLLATDPTVEEVKKLIDGAKPFRQR